MSSVIYFISSILFYISAILNFINNDSSMGAVYLCLGSTCLYLSTARLRKNKKR